jgi:MFS family permease
MSLERPARILPAIVVSQLAGTSLWFAGNAVLPDLQARFGWPDSTLGHMTSAVQLGFIAGTLAFALLAVSDRYSPRATFLACALLGAMSNGCSYFLAGEVSLMLATRFATGFFLAGVYPIGMKIAAGWFRHDLGKALGFLVGALVLGTALPHLIKGAGHVLAWEAVMLSVSAIAAAGGVMMYALVPDGPFLAASAKFAPGSLATIFRSAGFRASSFGYFGHMWELYAFWAFLPPLVSAHELRTGEAGLSVSLLAFTTIAAGALGCIGGGYFSLRFGSARVARIQLAASGLCCLLSPLMFQAGTVPFVAFLLVWGIAVVGDSPQFSALNASYAPSGQVGSALTIANCIGFGISIVSIQLLNTAASILPPSYLFLLLVPGPIFGLIALRPLLKGNDPGRR